MARNSSSEVIEAYRRRQERRFPFSFGDILKALLLLVIVAVSVYISFSGGPALPTLIELKTNTPTFTPSTTPTPSITPTASQTATLTSTPTETPDPENQCNCASPIMIVVTATFESTNTPFPTGTATAALLPTATLEPAETATPTDTSLPTPTQQVYTVRNGDTLSSIALKFGVSVEALQAANNLDSTMITIGQALKIPQP